MLQRFHQNTEYKEELCGEEELPSDTPRLRGRFITGADPCVGDSCLY